MKTANNVTRWNQCRICLRASHRRQIEIRRTDPVKRARRQATDRRANEKRRLNGASSYSTWKAWIKRKYGIDAETYHAMEKAQNGKCAICRQPETAKTRYGRTRKLDVDHHHRTGDVRGLLCNACNTGLGKFKDSPEILFAALHYLFRYSR